MRGELDEWDGGESEEDAPPRIAGDPRIERLRALITDELAAEYDMAEGKAWSTDFRSGLSEAQGDTKALAQRGESRRSVYAARKTALLGELREFQKDNPDRVGVCCF